MGAIFRRMEQDNLPKEGYLNQYRRMRNWGQDKKGKDVCRREE